MCSAGGGHATLLVSSLSWVVNISSVRGRCGCISVAFLQGSAISTPIKGRLTTPLRGVHPSTPSTRSTQRTEALGTPQAVHFDNWVCAFPVHCLMVPPLIFGPTETLWPPLTFMSRLVMSDNHQAKGFVNRVALSMIQNAPPAPAMAAGVRNVRRKPSRAVRHGTHHRQASPLAGCLQPACQPPCEYGLSCRVSALRQVRSGQAWHWDGGRVCRR